MLPQSGSTRPYKVKPEPEAGYIYLYSEDGKIVCYPRVRHTAR